MKINKKALIGMCGGDKKPCCPGCFGEREEAGEEKKENGFLDSKRPGSKETDGGIDV